MIKYGSIFFFCLKVIKIEYFILLNCEFLYKKGICLLNLDRKDYYSKYLNLLFLNIIVNEFF